MARRRLTDTSHADVSLNDEYWLRFSDEPQPSMRDKIIYLTFEEVAKVGPSLFNVSSVCDRLGITHPMVNHYFGSRDELLAETAYVVYVRYIGQLWEAVERAPKEPRARVEAWIRQQIDGTEELGGWGGVLNYPTAVANVSQIIERKYRDLIRERFETNLMGLALLVSDFHSGSVSDRPPTVTPEFREALLSNRELVLATSALSWATQGISVWNSGRHLPSAGIPEIAEWRDELIEAYIDRILQAI